MLKGQNRAMHQMSLVGLLARVETRLLLTLSAVLAAIVGFATLTHEVGEGETSRIDSAILRAFRTVSDPADPLGPRWVRESARDITALGGFTVLTLISLLTVVILLIHRRRGAALVFGASVLLAQAASELIKFGVGRSRPEVVPHLDLVYSSSFPSGHAMMSPVVYLTLAVVLAASRQARVEKVLHLAFALLLVFAIGVSRIYLGVHWPTDVLGGWTLGCAIAAAAAAALGLVERGPVRGNQAPR